ncbi:MAG: hypothetical protein JWN70_4007 [Planctomycetaceae bacterium]|nr:hypothetical protein [Planctomycetaceae bacterium]
MGSGVQISNLAAHQLEFGSPIDRPNLKFERPTPALRHVTLQADLRPRQFAQTGNQIGQLSPQVGERTPPIGVDLLDAVEPRLGFYLSQELVLLFKTRASCKDVRARFCQLGGDGYQFFRIEFQAGLYRSSKLRDEEGKAIRQLTSDITAGRRDVIPEGDRSHKHQVFAVEIRLLSEHQLGIVNTLAEEIPYGPLAI